VLSSAFRDDAETATSRGTGLVRLRRVQGASALTFAVDAVYWNGVVPISHFELAFREMTQQLGTKSFGRSR